MAEDVVHVFYIHSYIPSLIADSIINSNGLESNQVIIWNRRNRGRPWSDAGAIFRDLDLVPFEFQGLYKTYNLIKTKNQIKKIDGEISSAVGGKRFYLYIPHSYYQFFQLAATHHLCAGFSYIEEGLAAYRSNKEILSTFEGCGNLLWKLNAAQRFIYRPRIQGNNFFDNRAERAYGLGPHSFARLSTPKTILPVNWKQDPALSDIYDDCALIILSPMNPSAISVSNSKAYIDTLRDVAELLEKSPFKRIYIRPHPETKPDEPIYILNTAFNKLKGRAFIDSTTHPPEVICASSTKVAIISAGSSVSLYASILGRDVLSFAQIWSERSNAFKLRWSSLLREINFDFEQNDIRNCMWTT